MSAIGRRSNRARCVSVATFALRTLPYLACASAVVQCGPLLPGPSGCTSGDYDSYRDCGDYYGTTVCRFDGTWLDACSGGACCDLGYSLTFIDPDRNAVQSSATAGCKPGPAGVSFALCCKSAGGIRCPLPCGGAANCEKGQVCCRRPNGEGLCDTSPCFDNSQLCVTSSECTSGEVCGRDKSGRTVCSGGPSGSCGAGLTCPP